MKKFLTFMMLVLVGMTSQAQSGWSEPNGKYQAETVVYAVVDCGNYNELYNGNYVPEIAAFIDGEIRAYTTTYNVVGDNDLRLYTLRIGGVPGEDDNKVIDFKLYDLYRGLTYPLTPMYTTDDGIFPTEINWSGDNTLVQPSNYFTLSFKPVNEVKIYIEEVETDRFEMQVGQTRPMSHFHARLLDIEGNDATIPEEDGVFFIDGVKGTIAEKVTINGVDYVKAKACTSYSDEVGEYMYNVIGSYNLGKNFSFFIDLYAKIEPQYINVESIAIEDISTYFGEASISPTVVYNNGESEPTTPGVTYVSDNTNIVAVVKGELVPKGIGSATITATATDNTEVKTIFTMTVASALTKFVLSQTSADLYIG